VKIDRATRSLVRRALQEDTGRRGDVTTRHFLSSNVRYRAVLVAKKRGVLAGRDVAGEVFRQAAPTARLAWRFRDGQCFNSRAVLASIDGPREIMTAERTALNFLQHLSGIATLTSRYVAKVRGTRARIYDTRKTLPGFRTLAKYAVRMGGGSNHRVGLWDMAMLKDNHFAGWTMRGVSQREAANRLKMFRLRHPGVPVAMEAGNEREVGFALELKANIIMLDNMDTVSMRRHIRLIKSASPKTLIEISGGVDLGNVARLARLGPDRISIGRITHSAPALDISMMVLKTSAKLSS